jgi:isochorismate synthase
MSHSVFAFVYNPFSKSETVYIEANGAESDLTIVSFDKSTAYHLTKSDRGLKSLLGETSLNNSDERSTSREEFVNWVKKIQDLIASNQLVKIIAAQKEMSNATLDLQTIPDCLKKLIENLPNTFIYFYYFQNCAWIGASPELIGRTLQGEFITISLAGTTETSTLDFTSKEKEEQAIVSSFIEDILVGYNGQVQRNKTDSLAYGAISHLIDEYTTPLDMPEDFGRLVEQIHPSPALSGFPKLLAIEKIESLEPIQREWYCGHSIVREGSEHYAFAHIRCAKITANQLIYFAGAGITRDSIAEKEYVETKTKINILKEFINIKTPSSWIKETF